MDALDLDTRDVPKPWQPTVQVVKFSLAVLGTAGLIVGGIHLEATRAANDAVKEASAKDRADLVGMAREAAKQGARDALLESMTSLVRPLQDRLGEVSKDIGEHRKEDDERVNNLRDRIVRIENRLDALPAERRKVTTVPR